VKRGPLSRCPFFGASPTAEVCRETKRLARGHLFGIIVPGQPGTAPEPTWIAGTPAMLGANRSGVLAAASARIAQRTYHPEPAIGGKPPVSMRGPDLGERRVPHAGAACVSPWLELPSRSSSKVAIRRIGTGGVPWARRRSVSN
jgi:hypothetical protein